MMLPTLFLVLASLLASVSGQVVWLAATSGSWSSGANWQGGIPPLLGNLATEIIAAGTYTVSVDTNVALSGALASLTLGSDIVAGVNPTLAINAGVSAYYETMNVANGAMIQINAGASLWVTNLQFTAVNAANVVSGTGKLYVNGTLTYTASNAANAGNLVLPVQVNTSGVTVGNGATVQLTSSGGCYGNSGAAGAINLGSGSGSGSGNVVVSGNFDLSNCILSGNGNLTLNSSSAQTYVLATGSHTAGYIKAQGSSTLSLSGGGATTVAATLWIGGSAGRLVVAQANATTSTTVTQDVQIVAQGTSTAYVNSGFVVQGTLWVGSDTTSGVAATVQVASGVVASATTLRLATGGNAAVGANGTLTATTVTVTGSSNTTNSVSGSGWFNVTGSFTAATSGSTVQVSSPFALTGSLSVSNNATVVVSSNSGWSNGQINLGATNGGNLVVEGNWQHYQAPTGANGNFTFSPSSTINYALVAGTYDVAWVKTENDAHVWVVAAVTISGSLWVQDSARVTANQTLTVGQNIVVAGSGILEVAGANVQTSADASFASGSKYIIFAEDANPPKLMVSGAASLAGNIHIVSQFLVDGNDNTTVVVAEYASHTGTFGSVSAESNATVGTVQSLPMYSTSRRLLSSASYKVEYSSTNATAYRSGSNGAASLTPSVLLLGMMVAAMSFFVAL